MSTGWVSHPPPTPRGGVDLSVAVPLAVVHAAALGLAPVTWSPAGGVALVVGYLVTGFGVTAGAHRLVTHRAFRAHPALREALVLAFLLSGQGSIQRWVRDHVLHHRYSDRRGDPHSPRVDGLWHAHLGWLWQAPAEGEAGDLYRRTTRGLDFGWTGAFFRTGPRLAALHLAVMASALLGGAAWGGWDAGISVLVWGVLLRMVLVMHSTFLVNSASHRWGRARPGALDEARNNAVVAVLALGEGWHANHHARPAAANHGFLWWELDATYALVRVFARLGLARDVRCWDERTGRLEVRWPSARGAPDEVPERA